jgi:hypothetical protein
MGNHGQENVGPIHPVRACLLILALLVTLDLRGVAAPAGSTPARVPVIYCTDLFHPHEDPDDHFDLASIFAMEELDLRGIILDQGKRQRQSPGRIPVQQIFRISGREVPVATGLSEKLAHPRDTGSNQPAEHQGGVKLIIDTLRAAREPVRIAAVGSLRDVTAAFNREPDLFRSRVDRLLVFIGEASDPAYQEYNVSLDVHAFAGLFRSGLPIYWVPCFDGGLWQNKGNASFWRAKHSDLLAQTRPELIQYFIYALEKERSDPASFITLPVDPQRKARLFAGMRNLWCTAVFASLAGQTCIFDGMNYRFARPTTLPPGAEPLFDFQEVELMVNDAGVVQYAKGPAAQRVMRFHILRPERYATGMTALTASLLSGLGHLSHAAGSSSRQ